MNNKILKNNLTEHGQKIIDTELMIIKNKIKEKEKELLELKEKELQIEKVKNCIHHFKNQSNGMQLMESTCSKCNYTWFD